MYQLHAGEHVIPPGKTVREIVSGGTPHRVVIESLDDGSFGIKHESRDGDPAKEKTFSAKNARHLVRHVERTYNRPNPGTVLPAIKRLARKRK